MKTKPTNILAGKEQASGGFSVTSANDVYEHQRNHGGPQFITPSMGESMKSTAVLQTRTFFVPGGKGENMDISDQIETVTGIPVRPFKMEDKSITITGFRGYYPAAWTEGFSNDAAMQEMTVPDPVFKSAFDTLFQQFLIRFIKDGKYELEDGPTRADLKRMLAEVQAAVSQVTSWARQAKNFQYLKESTLVVAPAPVVLPARYSHQGDTPITIEGGAEFAKLSSPNEFNKTVVRLAYRAWFETCKYFGLGQFAPLLYVVYADTYGTAGAPVDVGPFIESILVQVNASGTYPKAGKRTSEQGRATEAVAVIAAEVFEAMLLYSVFSEIRQNYGLSQAVCDVPITWSHDYDTEYGAQVFNLIQSNMETMGVPSGAETGREIRCWPFVTAATTEDPDKVGTSGDVVKKSHLISYTVWDGYFALVPIKQGAPLTNYVTDSIELSVPDIGWEDGEGGKIVPAPTIQAEFDPNVGWVMESKVPAFLDVIITGDAWAGWIRRFVADSPQKYVLAITRVKNRKFSPGFGPMKVLDHVVGRRTVFYGNIVPFYIALPRAAPFCCDDLTYILSPTKIISRVESDLKE